MAVSGTAAIVYLATNVANGRRYVGVTKHELNSRKNDHFGSARRGSKYKFHCAIRKYGESSFIFEVLHKLDDYQEALACEVMVISELKPEYNLTLGGEGVRGLRMSEENKRKSIERHRGNKYWVGKKHTPESIAKMRAASLGQKRALGSRRSPEVKAKLSAIRRASSVKPMLGKKHSEESKAKISAAKTGVTPPVVCLLALNKHRASALELSAQTRRKTIVCVNDGLVFSCAKEAGEYYNMKDHKAIYHAIERGSTMVSSGLSFVYESAV